MARKIAATKIWELTSIAASSVATSQAVDIQEAEAMSVHLTAITGTSPSVTFTYALAPTLNGPFTTPQSPATIGATKSAVDVMDFAPEAAGAIKIIATNASTADAATITAYLVVQEAA